MLDEASIQAHSIVVVGRFNPSIFSPAWMRLHNLFGEQETEEAIVGFIIPPAANFSTDWLTLNVNEQSLSLSSGITQDYARLHDTAIGILSILKETPVSALGMNIECHWEPRSPEHWHSFGDDLAPKGYWLELGLRLPGLQDLTIRGIRDDDWAGNVNITIQPSTRIPDGLYGRVNDHYDLRQGVEQPSSRDEFSKEEFRPTPVEPSSRNIDLALTILGDLWIQSVRQSERLLSQLITHSRS